MALSFLQPEVAEEVRAAGPGQRAALRVGAGGEADQVRVHRQLPTLLVPRAQALTLSGPGLGALDLLEKRSSGRV